MVDSVFLGGGGLSNAPLPPLPADPLVTVVTVTYNHERFIAESVESVLAQGWPADRLQHVVVNDGSTDGTARALHRYRDRAEVVDQDNRGLNGAMASAMGRARGDVIVVCEGDDAMKPDRVAKVVRAFRDHPRAGLVYSDLELVDADGALLAPSFLDCSKLDRVNGRARGRLLRGNVIPGTSSAIRGCLKPLVDPTPPHAPFPDYWWAWAVAGVAEVVHLPEALVRYRIHGNNLSLPQELDRRQRAAARELPFRRALLAEVAEGEANVEELLSGIVQFAFAATQAGDELARLVPPRPDAADGLPLVAEGFALLAAGDLDGAALACAHATALRPFDPAIAILADQLGAVVEGRPAGARDRAQLDALDARRFVTLALASELLAAPQLLRGYAARFDANDDATLLIHAEPGEAAAAQRALGQLIAACGAEGPDAPDMVLAVEPLSWLRTAIVVADATLRPEVPYGPTTQFGSRDLDALRLVAEHVWSQAAVGSAAR
jgi:hypothetical protein